MSFSTGSTVGTGTKTSTVSVGNNATALGVSSVKMKGLDYSDVVDIVSITVSDITNGQVTISLKWRSFQSRVFSITYTVNYFFI